MVAVVATTTTTKGDDDDKKEKCTNVHGRFKLITEHVGSKRKLK